MSLTNLDTVKGMLGVSVNTYDDQFSGLIPAAERVIKTYLNRDIESQTYTQFYNGNNQYRLTLRQTPVTAVTSVYLDNSGFFGVVSGSFAAATALTEGIDFVLDREVNATYSKTGILFRIGDVWPTAYRNASYNRQAFELAPAFGNIKVIYTAGFTTIPNDIQYAVALLVAWMRRNIIFGGNVLLKEKMGDYAYEIARKRLDSDFELGNLRATLSPYREFGW